MKFDALTGVLLIPAVAACLLAALPGYRLTARLNVLAAFADASLTAVSLFVGRAEVRALSAGGRPQQGLHRADHLRRLHHQRVQRQLYRPRDRDRPADADLRALLSRHVPGADVRHEPRAGGQQYRPDVGGDRDGDADHRADGRHLPHPRGAGSGLEIFHPRQRRHRAGAVRHHSRLHGGEAGDRRRPLRHGVDRAGHARRRNSIRRCSTSPSCSCCSATAPKSASRRCTPGCPTRTRKARRRSRRCCPACCSTSRSMRCCASRCCWRSIRRRSRPAR